MKRWWLLKGDPVRVIAKPDSLPVTGCDALSEIELVERKDLTKALRRIRLLERENADLRALNVELHWKIHGKGGHA